MAVSAKFKTAYLQHTVVVDAKAAEDLTVNVFDLVTVKPDGTIAKPTESKAAEIDLTTPPEGTRYAIIGQSDVSMGSVQKNMTRAGAYDHVDVESKNLQYNSTVKLGTTPKRVSLFYVINPLDIVLEDYTLAAGDGRSEQLV